MRCISREVNASKIRQMNFVKMNEVEAVLHVLKNVGMVDIDEGTYRKMLELDMLPDGVKIEKRKGFVNISVPV